LLTLNYWVRLDSAIYSLFIWLSVGLTQYRTSSSRQSFIGRMVVMTVVPALGLIGYIATSYHLAGTFLPISGSVKAYYAKQHFIEYSWLTSLAGHVLWWVRIQCRPILDILSSILLASPLFRPLPMTVLVTVLAATFWGVRRIVSKRAIDPQQYRLMMFLVLIWVIGAFHGVLVVATIGHFSHVTQHYYGWLMVMWILWGALLGHQLLTRIKSVQSRYLIATFALVVFVTSHVWVASGRFLHESRPSFNERRFRISKWINENIPVNARIGAWNAGVLGYFSDRTVVNLDGLANDKELLQHLHSDASIQKYLRKEQIKYVVDVNFHDLTMPYRAAWDTSRLFRNSISWTDLEKLYVETSQSPPIFVLRIRDNILDQN